MARYDGPVCRLCRREGTKLFLKGERCNSEKCSLVRRAFCFSRSCRPYSITLRCVPWPC